MLPKLPTQQRTVRGWAWSRVLISARPWSLPPSTLVPAEMDWVSRAQTGLSDCILLATNPAMEERPKQEGQRWTF